MVKIKRFSGKQELTTKATAPQVNPNAFTGDLKALEALGDFFVQKAEAFQKVKNLNQKTKTKISFGATVDQLEDAFKNDPDLDTVSARSQQAYSKAIEDHAKGIDDELTRNQFLLFAESQAIDARNRIDTVTNHRILQRQKDDFEVGMTQDTIKINKLQFEGRHDDAQRLAQEKIADIAEMRRTFVIFPSVATARLDTLKESISGEGQMQYELDHMRTNSDMAVVAEHLTNNIYKLDKKTLSEKGTEFKTIQKALLGDQKSLRSIGYLENLAKITKGVDEQGNEIPLDIQIAVLRQAIKNGAAGLENGVDPILGAKVLAQAVAKKGTITDRRTEEQKWQAVGGKAILEMSRLGLGTDDNKIINPKNSKEIKDQKAQRSNDANIERVQTHFQLIVDLLDKGILKPGEAGKEMGKELELLLRRQDEKSEALFSVKKDAATEVTKGFFGIGKASIVSKEFLDRAQSVKDRQKIIVLNDFFEQLDEAATTDEVKGVVAQFKQMMTLVIAPSTINIKDGTPNGVVSADKPAEQINDLESTAKPDTVLKPKNIEVSTQLFLDKEGNTIKVTFEDGEPISREVINGD